MNQVWKLALALIVVAGGRLEAGEPCCPPITCVDDLFDLTECQLEALYRQGTCPPLFSGYLDGYSLNRAGKCLARPIGKSLHVVWKGKWFHPDECKITNRWFKKMEFASAALGHGPSLCDGCPALIMDYRGMSRIWARQRDEVRQIGPNLYLGMAYREKKGCLRFAQFFALQGCCVTPCE